MGLGRIRSAASWLQAKCRISGGEAFSRTRAAKRVHELLPRTAETYGAGEITFGHVRALSNAVGGIDPELVAEAEPYLLTEARRSDAGRFGVAAREWRHRLDAELARVDATYREEMRSLHASKTFEGMVAVDGILDANVGETLPNRIGAARAEARTGGHSHPGAAPARRIG